MKDDSLSKNAFLGRKSRFYVNSIYVYAIFAQ